MKLLRLVTVVSGSYDALVGAAMLFAMGEVLTLFGLEAPRYPIQANLNGLFLLAIGAGYFAIARRPQEHLWYLWIMGVALKGGGAALFVVDQVLRDSPASFLLFSASDGALAALTLWAIRRAAASASGRAAEA